MAATASAPAEEAVNAALSTFIAGLFVAAGTGRLPAAAALQGCRVVADDLRPVPRRWGKQEDAQLDEVDFERRDTHVQPGPELDSGAFLEAAMRRLRLPPGEPLDSVDVALRCPTRADAAAEKKAVKYELKRHDSEFRSVHYRMPTRAEKEPLRPLYMYYRKLKQHLEKAEGADRGGGGGSDDEDQAGGEEPEDAAAQQLHLLEQRLRALQDEKNAVRAKLQKFQERFVAENNRKIRYHKDIVPIERDYRMYKQVKDDIAKLEGQIRELRSQVR